MDELLEHFSRNHLPSLYRNEATKRIEYNEILRFIYIIMRRALVEGADQLEITKSDFRWSRQGEILGEFKNPPPGQLSYTIQMRKIVEVDSVVRKNIKIKGDILPREARETERSVSPQATSPDIAFYCLVSAEALPKHVSAKQITRR